MASDQSHFRGPLDQRINFPGRQGAPSSAGEIKNQWLHGLIHRSHPAVIAGSAHVGNLHVEGCYVFPRRKIPDALGRADSETYTGLIWEMLLPLLWKNMLITGRCSRAAAE